MKSVAVFLFLVRIYIAFANALPCISLVTTECVNLGLLFFFFLGILPAWTRFHISTVTALNVVQV